MKVGVAGLGYWGPNLARNFDELGDLAWICEADGERLASYAIRYPTPTTPRLTRRCWPTPRSTRS